MNTIDFETTTVDRGWVALFLAWLLALTATLGALFIGEIMGREPCLLCWYQRIAMFPLVLILGIACYVNDRSVGRYAIGLTGLGGALALWHSLLYFGFLPTAIEPCEQGVSCTGSEMTIFGVVPLPLLSLAVFVAITFLVSFAYPKDQS